MRATQPVSSADYRMNSDAGSSNERIRCSPWASGLIAPRSSNCPAVYISSARWSPLRSLRPQQRQRTADRENKESTRWKHSERQGKKDCSTLTWSDPSASGSLVARSLRRAPSAGTTRKPPSVSQVIAGGRRASGRAEMQGRGGGMVMLRMGVAGPSLFLRSRRCSRNSGQPLGLSLKRAATFR